MRASLEASFATQLEAKSREVEQLADALKAKELAEVAAKEKARLTKLTDAVGTAKAPQLSTALQGLSDESFDVVVAELSAIRKLSDDDEIGDIGDEVDSGDEGLSLDERTALEFQKMYKDKR